MSKDDVEDIPMPCTLDEIAELGAADRVPIEKHWNSVLRTFRPSSRIYVFSEYSKEEVEALAHTLRARDPLGTYEVLTSEEAMFLSSPQDDSHVHMYFEKTNALKERLDRMFEENAIFEIWGYGLFVNNYASKRHSNLKSVFERSKARKREGSEVPVAVEAERV